MALSEGYKKYMNSNKWYAYRKRRLEEANYECELCSKHGCALDVHHLTYENFMHEEMKDTLVCCRACHKYADRIRKLLKRLEHGDSRKHERALNVLKRYGYPFNMKANSRDKLKKLWKQLKRIEKGKAKSVKSVLKDCSSSVIEAMKEHLKA